MLSIKKRTTGRQILVFFSLILFLCIIALDTIFFCYYYNYHYNTINTLCEQIAAHNFDIFEYNIEHYKNILYNISVDNKIIELLLNNNLDMVDRSLALNSEIEKFLHNENINLTIFPEDTKSFFITPYVRNVDNLSEEEWYYKNTTEFRSFFSSNNTISLVAPINNPSLKSSFKSRIATVKITFNIENILPKHIDSLDVLIKDSDENIVYSTVNNENILSFVNGKKSFSARNNYLSVFVKELYHKQFNIYYIFNQKESFNTFMNVILLTLCISAIIYIIFLMCSVRYTKNITQKITSILNNMHAYEKDLWQDTVSSPQDSDELLLIDNGLKHMISELRSMIEKQYIYEIEIKNARLEALQLQINPHFLYNTLETINQLALSGDTNQAHKISIISQNLGKLLRYNVTYNNNIWTTVESEIENIISYIDIQNIRYDNKFEFYIDISPETKECIIPKFIIQPIIENSIKHAFTETAQFGTITVEAFQFDNYLYINIQDDGKGMTDLELSKIKSELNDHSYSDKHIGLRNIHKRIQLAFGTEYGMSIESKLNSGTSVCLKLPYRKEPYDFQNA